MGGIKKSKIEALYGVPVPYEVLLRWLGERYGAEVEREARAVFKAATARYGRAVKIHADGQWLKRLERYGGTETEASRQKQEKVRKLLEDPMAFINGGDQ